MLGVLGPIQRPGGQELSAASANPRGRWPFVARSSFTCVLPVGYFAGLAMLQNARWRAVQGGLHERSQGQQHSSLKVGVGSALLVASALLLLTPAAWAAVVKGKVNGIQKLTNPVWNEAKEPSANRYTWREPSPTVRAEFRHLFPYAPKELCIAAISASPVKANPAPIAFKIGGGRTSPVTLVVAPGTVIEFQNRDPFPHRPYIVSTPSFVAADMKSASSRQWTVPATPGKYELRDELFPSIRSWIVVDANVAGVAYPSRDGAFQFGNLPPGDYTLKAFFSGEPTGKTLSVKLASEAPIELRDALVVAEDQAAGAKK